MMFDLIIKSSHGIGRSPSWPLYVARLGHILDLDLGRGGDGYNNVDDYVREPLLVYFCDMQQKL